MLVETLNTAQSVNQSVCTHGVDDNESTAADVRTRRLVGVQVKRQTDYIVSNRRQLYRTDNSAVANQTL